MIYLIAFALIWVGCGVIFWIYKIRSLPWHNDFLDFLIGLPLAIIFWPLLYMLELG